MKNILTILLLTLAVSSFGQTYGWMIRIDPGQDADTANMGIMYPDGSGNLTGRMHFVSYATVLEKLAAFSPDTVYVNAGDSLVIVSIDGDTTYFAGGGGGGVADGDKGDITVSSGGTVWTIDNLAITNGKIANDAIDASKIAPDAVGSSEIATNAVGSSEIATGGVQSIDILDNTITGDDIATDALSDQHFAPSTLAGFGITDGALDANVVHKTGDETINGEKTLNDSLRVDDYAAFLGTDGGYATKIEMLKNGTLQIDTDNGAAGDGRVYMRMNPYTSANNNTSFNFSMTRQDNVGIDRDNDVFNMGFNLTGGGSLERDNIGESAMGLSFENLYRVSGSDYSEFHLFFIDTNNVQYRPITFFLNRYDPLLWSGSFHVPKIEFRPAADVDPYFQFTNPDGIRAAMKFNDPASNTGVELSCNPAARTFQFAETMGAGSTFYADQFDYSEFSGIRRGVSVNTPTKIIGVDGSGWLGDISLGWGLDLTGGTLLVDSSQVATQYDLTSKLNVSDTAAMLSHYVERGDTLSMLSHYIERGDTSSMLSNYIDRSSTETIYGVKTFNADPVVPDEAYSASTWDGTNEPPTKNAIRDYLESLDDMHRFYYFNDFVSNVNADVVGRDMFASNTGTSAGITSTTSSSSKNAVGVAVMTTGTTSTGRACLTSSQVLATFGGGDWTFEVRIDSIPTLSTGSERYSFGIGFIDNNTSNANTDGAYFLYDEGGVTAGSTASANWQCVSASNSNRTYTTSSAAVTTTPKKLKITVNAAGTEINYYVDGALVATHLASSGHYIPTTPHTRVFGLGAVLLKSVGSTARTVNIDYMKYVCNYTTVK